MNALITSAVSKLYFLASSHTHYLTKKTSVTI